MRQNGSNKLLEGPGYFWLAKTGRAEEAKTGGTGKRKRGEGNTQSIEGLEDMDGELVLYLGIDNKLCRDFKRGTV